MVGALPRTPLAAARPLPRSADSCRAIQDPGSGSSEHRRQLVSLITARRLIAPGVLRRIYSYQPVQIGIHVQDWIFIVVPPDEQNSWPFG